MPIARHPVIVVGAGPSGLTAARRIRAGGWPVLVLDAGERPGGKLQTHHHDGFVMEAGAALVSDAYSQILQVASDAGMVDRLVAGGSVLGVARGGRIHHIDTDHPVRDGLRTPVLSWRSKLLMARVLLDNRRFRPLLDFTDLSAAGVLDVETPREYADRRLNREIYDYVVDSVMRGINGVDGAHASVVEFFFTVNKILGSALCSFDRGMTSFVEALTADLDVRSGQRVTSVSEVAGGVRVEHIGADGAHHSTTGAAAIVAIAGDVAAEVVEGLDPDVEAHMRGLTYSKMVNLNVGLSRRPSLPGFAIQIPRPESEGLFTISLDHNNPAGRAPEGKGLLGLYATSEWASSLIGQDDEAITEQMCREADRVVPGIVDDACHVRVNRWERSLVYSRPGLYRDLGRILPRIRRDGLVHLAGDWFSSSNMNSAASAGHRAAGDLLTVLDGVAPPPERSGAAASAG